MRLERYKEWVISALEDVLCREDRFSQFVCNLLYVSASKKNIYIYIYISISVSQ